LPKTNHVSAILAQFAQKMHQKDLFPVVHL